MSTLKVAGVELRTAIQNLIAHYHSERNDRGLGNFLIRPETDRVTNTGKGHDSLGGMLNYYDRAAA